MFEFLNSFAGRAEWADILIISSATLLPYWVLGAAFIFFLRSRKIILEALAAVILSRFLLTEIIRLFYNRPRPFDLPAEALVKAGLEPVYQLFSHDPGYAFPSGHAAFFFALAAIIFLYHKGWGSLFFGAALLISISRVIAGIHWTSDILAGAAIGIASALLVHYFANRSSSVFQAIARKKASM